VAEDALQLSEQGVGAGVGEEASGHA
jgi:hypothetical protein